MRNQVNMALWGQCVGDSIGRYLLNKSNAETVWEGCIEQRKLPFKRGKYSVYAYQSLTFVTHHHNSGFIDQQHFETSLISRLRLSLIHI